MKTWSLLRLVLAAAAAAAFAGCTANGGTIYATIETETQVTDNSLSNTLTVAGIAMPTSGTYYVAAGTIYKGTLSNGAVTWTPNAASAAAVYNPSGALSNALAASSSAFWAGFITAGSNLGLYESPGPEPTSWTAVSDTNVSGKQVTMLRYVNGKLFMAGATLAAGGSAYQYELDYSADGTTWSTPAVTGLAAPITGIAYDGTATYYMASGGTVVSDTNPAGAFATTETLAPALASGDLVNGIYGDTASHRVFALTKLGGLYEKLTPGGAWTQVVAPTVSSVTVSLLSMAGPVDAAGDTYLVGSDGYGYYTFSVGTGTFTRLGDSTIGLYTASVGSILVDATTVLMGTNGAGLWRATFDATGTQVGAWTHE